MDHSVYVIVLQKHLENVIKDASQVCYTVVPSNKATLFAKKLYIKILATLESGFK